MKYLPLYKKWMETAELPSGIGMCTEFRKNKLLKLFEPDEDERSILLINQISATYWGSGQPPGTFNNSAAFTPMRQTILLFMAAMNGEL